MGTNYYHRTKICTCCGRYHERHICKNLTSFEWVSEWLDEPPYGDRPIVTSWADWKKYLTEREGQVYDEYGEHIPLDDFIAKVEATSREARSSQFDWYARNDPERTGPPGEGTEWLDADGFSFYGGAFS